MVPANRRSNLVSFRKLVKLPSPDGFNDTESWVEVCQAWVSISPNRGDEVAIADERTAVVTHTVRGDYFELVDVQPAMCMILDKSASYSPVAANARWFDILAIMADEDMHADMMIKVQEKSRGYGV